MVTAAALIMFSVFGAFVISPDAVIKSIGLALAVGVLVDAFVVRMTLVPAAMALLGRPRLVAAEVARPAAAEPRHRGRVDHPEALSVGFHTGRPRGAGARRRRDQRLS